MPGRQQHREIIGNEHLGEAGIGQQHKQELPARRRPGQSGPGTAPGVRPSQGQHPLNQRHEQGNDERKMTQFSNHGLAFFSASAASGGM